MDTKIIDKGGEYFVNPNTFAFVDPDPVPEKQTRFEPGNIYKVKMEPGSWLETQYMAGVLRKCDDEGNMEPVPTPKKAEVAVVAANATVPAGTLHQGGAPVTGKR